jgi:hypothetical protein
VSLSLLALKAATRSALLAARECELDTPLNNRASLSFPAPIYASLVKGEKDDSFDLI